MLALCENIALAQIDFNASEIPWQSVKDTDLLWTKMMWREVSPRSYNLSSINCIY